MNDHRQDLDEISTNISMVEKTNHTVGVETNVMTMMMINFENLVI